MAHSQTARIPRSARRAAVAALPLAALLWFVPGFAQSSRAGTGEVIAIREIELRPGVSAADFERFAIGTYNPRWEGAVPGMRGYIAKADRGVQKGRYALMLVFDSEKTRNAIFPKEGGGASERFTSLVDEALALNKELEKYIEPGTLSVYTDYVAMR